ncbi:two-component regulator propeller domain-containing protein [Pedobacter sp. UBA4863]|uniref:ligand-binding sensor domain-containing protein n=1 Tax=Pedobacter sp. UBA4863 TaxID=1947060 RepID=UPI0025DBE10C|nr:sensor histidine kinase [Pedobacter sp. UBA4863]
MLIKLFSIFVRNLLFLLLLPQALLWAQNYNFTNYNLKEGLPQSQVSVIFQASNRLLWLGTNGGLSCFDGNTFTSYSKADGLLSNNINCITEDAQHRIIIGSNNGINVVEKGLVKKIAANRPITNLHRALDGTIWGISDRKLFRLRNNKMEFQDPEYDSATTINVDSKGNLYVALRGLGVLVLKGEKWKKYIDFPKEISDNYVVKLLFDKKNQQRLYIITLRKGIFIYENGRLIPFYSNTAIEAYFDADIDANQNIWIATMKGAYLLAPDKSLIVFNSQNGLTDNRIAAVFNDAENNIWISSFTDGIFKFDGNAFIKYDRYKGRHIGFPISGLAVDKHQNLWVSTFNNGVFKFDGNVITQPDSSLFSNKNIYLLGSDNDQNIIVSLQNQGLWKHDGKRFAQVPFTEGINISAFVQDTAGAFYLGEMTSIIYLKNHMFEKISGFKGWVSCLYNYAKDSILLGTSSGAYLIKDKKIQYQFNIPALNDMYVLCIIKQENHILFSTLGDGIISYNTKTKKTAKITTLKGLNSNDVYSLLFDKKGFLWASTGRGINKLKPNRNTGEYEVITKNSPIVECNQNALVKYGDDIIVGTTSGVMLCNTAQIQQKNNAPFVFLQKINAYHKTNKEKDTSFYINESAQGPLQLNFNQNHVSISYKGISLNNPQNINYRYKLIGLDNEFSKPITSTEVEYSVLKPGSYTFQVYAEVSGQKSAVHQFSFVIVPPFYDMWWFKLLVIALFIFLLWAIIYSIFKKREQKKKQIEQIKLQEQAKIRKQTAEDFHDDIGNKLTRINVLSEILDKKINEQQADQKKLIRMIKENAGFLYTGTKDVLWALDPKSDNFYEIMQHIRDFGIDLFQDTTVSFQMEDVQEQYRQRHMSMEQNRNLTLIFKEILTNILKHAHANKVTISVFEEANKTIKIQVIDDGIGFDLNEIKQGQGLENIKTRCKRINAGLVIKSGIKNGTSIVISGIKSLQK